MGSEIKNKVEAAFKMHGEDLKNAFVPTFNEIQKNGIARTTEQVPDLFSRIIKRLLEIDAAKFVSDVPEAADILMKLLWEYVGISAQKSDDLRLLLKDTRDLTFNLEAADSPFRSHFKIGKGGLTGGVGLVHFKDQDIRFMGSTESLMQFLVGELEMRKLTMEGHAGLRPIIRPIIQGIQKVIKGK